VKEQNALPKFARDRMACEQHAGAAAHPDADLLTAFSEGALGETERDRVMDHIARCGECREIVFLAAPEILLEQAPVKQPQPVVSGWRRFMPVMAAAAAIVVVGSAVLLNRPGRMETPSAKIAEAPQSSATRSAEAPTPEPQSTTPQPAAAVSDKSLATKKQATTPLSDVMAEQKDQRSRPDVSNAEASQQQITASGAHGPIAPKGNATNYQNLAVTPARPTSNLPTAAGKYGPVEAAGNSSNYAYGMPETAKNQPVIGGIVGAQIAPAEKAKVAGKPAATPPITVTASAPQTAEVTTKTRDALAKKELRDSQSEIGGFAANSAALDTASTEVTASRMVVRAHWRITKSGGLERSFGNGQWSAVLSDAPDKFRVVSVIGNDVWAGGNTGALYHSRDAGEHWIKIPLEGVTEPITSIQFRDASSGTVKTESGAKWETSDGGAHWTRK
jgi:hypothetical protein